MRTLAAALAFVALSSAMGCAAPAPTPEARGETGSFLLSGTVLTAEQVADAVRQAGFPEDMVGKMVCTAKYESSFYENASNGSHYGLFQIAQAHLGESGCASTVNELYVPANNAACAFAIYQTQGLGAWTAYGSHKAECDAYTAPGSSPTSADGNDPSGGSATNDPSMGQYADNGNGMQGGGCYSSTDSTMVNDGACVQSADYGLVQCHRGQWYQAANDGSCNASDQNGPSGQDDGEWYGSASYRTKL